MTENPCLRCGAPAHHGHHPTGRLDGYYLDPDLVIELCGACHISEHAARSALGLDRGAQVETGLEVVELWLRRLAVSLARLADSHPWLGPLAQALESSADRLAETVQRLDCWDLRWRSGVGR